MKKAYIVYKKWGETPLEATERLRRHLSIAPAVPMTYAGRLDPAVEGLLIILIGEECKKKENYTGLRKTYVAEIVIGISTDTFDLLGIPKLGTDGEDLEKRASDYLDDHLGLQMQTYPPYSSKTVYGTQLHELTRMGANIDLPSHEVMLYGYSELAVGSRTRDEIRERAAKIASITKGDFRQKEIVREWQALRMSERFATITVTIDVGTGFYVRQLAEDLGRALGTGACLYSLVRTEVGDYTKADL